MDLTVSLAKFLLFAVLVCGLVGGAVYTHLRFTGRVGGKTPPADDCVWVEVTSGKLTELKQVQSLLEAAEIPCRCPQAGRYIRGSTVMRRASGTLEVPREQFAQAQQVIGDRSITKLITAAKTREKAASQIDLKQLGWAFGVVCAGGLLVALLSNC